MAIELSAVRYRYAGASAAALVSIELRLEPGRVVGVAGADESGKSTLCLVVAGLAPGVIGGRLDGSVRIDGVETTATMVDIEGVDQDAVRHLASELGAAFRVRPLISPDRSAPDWPRVAMGVASPGVAGTRS